MAYTVGELQQALERLAPAALAESWDNVGLLLGDAAQAVTAVMVALDATLPVLEQAGRIGAELLVVHHPLIFSGLKRLVEDGGAVSLARRMIREGRSLVALHTNLDSAPCGLNCYVAEMLGMRATQPLALSTSRSLLKLVVYVPETHAEVVREALCQAGAGHIGRYSECTFSSAGIGSFRPDAGTSPFIGQPDTLERVPEVRLETVIPRAVLPRVLRAMLASHPYEEVAYDLFSLENTWPDAGLGRIGTLEAPVLAGEFLETVRSVLPSPRASFIGDPAKQVYRVALCTGAGGDLWEDALHAGADLFLTGEVKHHQALLARQHGLAVIDAGHFATERPAVALLAEYLNRHFPELPVHRAEEEDPFA